MDDRPDGGELFRRYLQTRRSLGEPELVLDGLSRRQARRCARRAALGDQDALAALAGSDPGDADAAAGASGREDGPAERSRADAVALPDEEVGRLAREGTAAEIAEIPDLETLRAVAERCVRCPLHETRQQVVFGEGADDARIVCVGEAPGAREDETGRPFVGRAGRLLNRLLLAVGYRRGEVYICNVLKSRPPGNRDPEPAEIEACSPYLLKQIEFVDPDVIVGFGAFASRTLLAASGSLGSLRGDVHDFRGYPLVATYHPAAVLRNPRWRRPAWRDLQTARSIVEAEVK